MDTVFTFQEKKKKMHIEIGEGLVNIHISACNSKGAGIQLFLIRFIIFLSFLKYLFVFNFTKSCDCMLKTIFFCGYILLSKRWYRLVMYLQTILVITNTYFGDNNFELWKVSLSINWSFGPHNFVYWFFTFINHLKNL